MFVYMVFFNGKVNGQSPFARPLFEACFQSWVYKYMNLNADVVWDHPVVLKEKCLVK